MRVRIYFTILFVLIGGCGGDDKSVVPAPETVVTCSPYFVADYNNIVRIDRLKNSYSAEMTGLCTSFQVRHKAVSKCGAYQEQSGALEVVNSSTIDYLCGRNEKIAAGFNAQPGLLSTESKDKGRINFNDSGEVTLKLMVLNAKPFIEARDSTKNFSQRKVFSSGKSMPLPDVAKKAYCLFSSSAPLQDNDTLQVINIEDVTKNKTRTLNFSADVYRGDIMVSISCIGIAAKDDPKAVLKRHFGSLVLVE